MEDASPEVLKTMGVAANIHEDHTITPERQADSAAGL